jgi:NLI interacting factor-like phosphatase
MAEPSEGGRSALAGVPRAPPRLFERRWLNIVFDLNGILCACEEFRFKDRNLQFNADTAPHSSTVPAHVGPKLVWVRPGCKAFLEALSKFATISIWSSMKVSTTRVITEYLFKNIVYPKITYGQENCKRVITSVSCSRPTFLKVKGTEKDVFLKTLSTGLFPKHRESITKDNTIIIDDSPYKHVLNDPENVLLSFTWSYKGDGPTDNFLLDVLLPWLRRMHNSFEMGI